MTRSQLPRRRPHRQQGLLRLLDRRLRLHDRLLRPRVVDLRLAAVRREPGPVQIPRAAREQGPARRLAETLEGREPIPQLRVAVPEQIRPRTVGVLGRTTTPAGDREQPTMLLADGRARTTQPPDAAAQLRTTGVAALRT
ncbi:MAG TPA: hypothetical protein VE545_02365 [Candidatus Dormibacteraeota bacterium]|nr:hypothetical protein [Candidatus Dormibacteraeota bacterium]